jgi:hypothetical protein
MNIPFRSLCLAVSLSLAAMPALAGNGHRHKGYYAPPPHHHGHHHHKYRWGAPAAALAITGLAAGVAAATWYATPRPVYVAPPPAYVPPQPVYVPARPAGGYWHYCPSAGGYYPEVNYCPEGWQAVYR